MTDAVERRLDVIEHKIDQILAALRAVTNVVTETHQERIELTRRVATLEHRVALLEAK